MLQPSSGNSAFDRVCGQFRELLGSDPLPPIRQSILLREGFYVGLRFACEGWTALWRGDLQTIEIFDPAGQVVRRLVSPDDRQSRGSFRAA